MTVKELIEDLQRNYSEDAVVRLRVFRDNQSINDEMADLLSFSQTVLNAVTDLHKRVVEATVKVSQEEGEAGFLEDLLEVPIRNEGNQWVKSVVLYADERKNK